MGIILPKQHKAAANLASRLFILIILFSFSQTITAREEDHFSALNNEEYFEAIEDIFKSSSERKRGKDYLDRFEEFWFNPNTPAQVKKTIKEFSDFLYEKRASAFPNYHLLLTTVQAFVTADQTDDNFSVWREGIKYLMGQRRFPLRDLNEVLQTTKDILKEQKIYSTPAVEWFSRSPEFSFFLDKDSLHLTVDDTRLVCFVRDDSLNIHDTEGVLNLINGQWKGERGKITWEQNGFDSNQVYALFDEYKLDMSQSDFHLENVTFYNNIYFNEPLKGSLEHKIRPIRRASGSNYPKFESYEQVFSIRNIHPGMHYKGGFSQYGAKYFEC
jgi:hypothetical protein